MQLAFLLDEPLAGARRSARSAVARPAPARTPARPTQPIRRAGTPTTSAKSGTSPTTTAPAPTIAQRPTVTGATQTARAPERRALADDDADRRPVGCALELARRRRRPAGAGRW